MFFILTTVASVVYFVGTGGTPMAQPMRFTVTMPENVRLASMLTAAGASTAVSGISPDGRTILLSGVDETTGKIRFYVRPVDSVDARPLPGTEDATFPFWSPDSDNIAFFAERKLKRVGINGGEPQIVCDAPAAAEWLFGGGTWNRDDVILAHLDLRGGLSKVSARGGTASPLTTLSDGEVNHLWLQFLPDGNHFLYFVTAANFEDTYILELATGKETRFTIDPAIDQGPVWSPDSSSILYSSARKDAPGLYRKNANGSGGEELIYQVASSFVPYQWPMPDTFIYFGGTDLDLQVLSLHDRKSASIGLKGGGGADGSLSPDGKWLSYYARDTGQLEVTTYPPSGTRIVIAPGGVDSHWSRKGDAIFYLNGRTGELMSVDVTPGNPPRFDSPRRVYAGPLDFFTIHSFDLTPNEDRFIVHTPDPGGDITVLLNWPSLLK